LLELVTRKFEERWGLTLPSPKYAAFLTSFQAKPPPPKQDFYISKSPSSSSYSLCSVYNHKQLFSYAVAVRESLAELVEAPSLQIFKARLDGALSNLVHLKMSLLTAGGLG